MAKQVSKELMEGEWVCFDRGTRLPADQCPPDAQLQYFVDHVSYDSPEAYAQIQETMRVQGAANRSRFDQNPEGYPPCTNDPPTGPEVQCGSESCDMHNILWMETEGFNHEQAIGLTAVYNFTFNAWGYGTVAEALGGLDEFDDLTDGDQNIPGLSQWYNDHKPLVEYIMETHEKHGLYEYWLASRIPGYEPRKWGQVSIHLFKGPDGQWQPYQVPGHPLIIPEGYDQWSESYDAAKASMDPDQWATHAIGHFEFELP